MPVSSSDYQHLPTRQQDTNKPLIIIDNQPLHGTLLCIYNYKLGYKKFYKQNSVEKRSCKCVKQSQVAVINRCLITCLARACVCAFHSYHISLTAVRQRYFSWYSWCHLLKSMLNTMRQPVAKPAIKYLSQSHNNTITDRITDRQHWKKLIN